MQALIPQELNAKLDEIVTKCFAGNRIADRGMSILAVKFAMNKSEKILHPKIAHLFPALADKVSGFQDSRNNLTFYGLTPADNTDYATPLDFFESLLDYMVELEALVSDVHEMAEGEDFPTCVFLQSFMLELIPLTGQCILLRDKMSQYGQDIKMFDENIESFVIL